VALAQMEYAARRGIALDQEPQRQRRQRSMVFALLSVAYFMSFVQRVALSVVAAELAEELHIGTVELGLMSSAFFVAYAAAQPVVGILSDLFGPMIVVSCCLCLGTIGTWMFAASRSMTTAFAGRILIGAGLSGIFIPGVKVITMLYDADKFASVNGLFLALGNAGAVLGTAPMAWLASAAGWRCSFAIIGVLLTALTVLCWAMSRAQRPQATDGNPGGPRRGAGRTLGTLRVFLHDRNLWLMSLFMFARYGSQTAFQGLWGIPHIMSIYQVSREQAAAAVMMIGLGYIINAPLVGRLADRLSRLGGDAFRARRAILACTTGAYALTWIPIVLLPGRLSMGALYVLLFTMGLGASSGGLGFAIVKDQYPPEAAGSATSAVNIMSIIGASAIPPIVGVLIHKASEAGAGIGAVYGVSLWPCLVAGVCAWLAAMLLRNDSALTDFRKFSNVNTIRQDIL
jgi:MFS family permease